MFLLLNKPERVLRGELGSTCRIVFSDASALQGSPVLNVVLQIQIIDHKRVPELFVRYSFVQWKSFQKQIRKDSEQ